MSTTIDNSVESTDSVEIPAHVLRFIKGRVPRFKDEPKQFCGREQLLEDLEKTVIETVQAKDPEETPPGQILFAAPGAGKTSVIAELKKRLEKKKLSVIRIQPSEIISARDFNELILEQHPWKYVEWLKKLGKTVADILKKPADKAAGFTLTIVLNKMGIPAGIVELPIFSTVVDQWLAGKQPKTKDVLRLLQHGRSGGCVLIIDEAQDMSQYMSSKKYRKHMHQIIDTLGVPSSRAGASVTKGTIILAGLSDTPTIVEETGSQGITPMVLPPLPRRHVEEMIANGIKVGAGGDNELSKQARELWLMEIANRYGDWTRHAKAGALAVEDLLREFQQELVDAPWGTAAIHELGVKYQNYMYESILERTSGEETDRGVGDEIIDLVVWSLACNGNRVTRSMLRRVVMKGLQCLEDPEEYSGERGKRMARKEGRRILQRMLRTGLLERTNRLPHRPDRVPKAYYCPIPSLLDHTVALIGTSREAMDEILADERLLHGTITPKADRFHPTWPDDDG